jgi:transcriptional regulator with XRE-family HTH domain
MGGTPLWNLKWVLAARGLHQEDLAMKTRICRTTVSRIIIGRMDASPGQRAAIAGALKLDPEWLFAKVVLPPRSAPKPAGKAG